MLFRRLEERPATPKKFVNVGRPRILWISAKACAIISDAERKILRKAGSQTTVSHPRRLGFSDR
jgi:hypothetical protein